MREEKGRTGKSREEPQLFSVGEACSMADITRKALFYYDRIGLLTPTERFGPQNFKLYDSEKIERLRKILGYREAGLRIAEIRELLDGKDVNHLEVFQKALARMETEKEETEEKIQKLQILIDAERQAEHRS